VEGFSSAAQDLDGRFRKRHVELRRVPAGLLEASLWPLEKSP
jgi:hypothetical protein